MNIFNIKINKLPILLGGGLAITIFQGMTLSDLFFPIIFFLLVYNQREKSELSSIQIPVTGIFLFYVYLLYMISLFFSDLFAKVNTSILLKDQLRLASVLFIAGVVSSRYFRMKDVIKKLLFTYFVFNLIVILYTGSIPISSHNFWRHGIGESTTLGIASILPYHKKKTASLCLFVLAALNIYLDYRGLALVLFVCIFLLNFGNFLRLSFLKKVAIVFFLIVIMVGGMVTFLQSQRIYEKRRDQSNAVRAAMVYVAINDMIEPKIFGNGTQKFKDSFKIPDIVNAGLLKDIDGNLPLHGYLFSASYNAGKAGLFFYLMLLSMIVKFIFHKIYYIDLEFEFSSIVILVYFFYSSFLQAFSGFDRILLGLSIGILIKASSQRSMRMGELQEEFGRVRF